MLRPRLDHALRAAVMFLSISVFLTACTDSHTDAPRQETPEPTVVDVVTATVPTPTPSPTGTPHSGGPVGSPKGAVTVEPEQGDCGRYITVRGHGFQAGVPVEPTLIIGGKAFSAGGPITVPADGVFVQKLPLLWYSECRDGEQVRVVARDARTPRTGGELALLRMPDPEAVYTIINPSAPTFALSATSGPCDATIELTGTNLAAHTRKVLIGLMRAGTDHPSTLLGAVEIGPDRGFRLPVRLGADGCAAARVYPASSDLDPFVLVMFDATESPFLRIGGLRYTPTTGGSSTAGGAHRNPPWTEPTCCL